MRTNAKHILGGLLLVASLLFAAGEKSVASVRLQLVEVANVDWTGGPGAGYSVFDPAEVRQVIRFKVKLVEGSASSYFVTFSAGGSGDFLNREVRQGNSALKYQIYDSAGSQRRMLKALPSATASEILSGAVIGEGEIQELAYVVVVDPGQVRMAGPYVDTFTITLYSGTLEDFTEEDAKEVVVSVPVGEVTELSLLASGGLFTPGARSALMDFGTLRQDDYRELDLRVRSNAGYSVSLESENSGVLKHTSSGVSTTVPYTLRLAGATVDLGDGPQTPVLQPGRMTDAMGDVYPLSVTIGVTGTAVAGTYRDVITITVVSQN